LQVPDRKCLIQVEMLSVDAFIRTTFEEDAYHGTTKIGDTVVALGYGPVVKTCVGGPALGTYMQGAVMAQTFAMVDLAGPNALQPMAHTPGLPRSLSLGLFGVTTGMTAYVGVFCVVSPPKEGEVCIVSAAAGAVGNIAAQLAKSTGARVIGIAGGSAKCEWLRNTLKLDDVIDYKDTKCSLGEQIDKVCPDGVDFFYDNVGGSTLDDVLWRIRPNGRIVICGAISQYSKKKGDQTMGPSNYLKLAERGATMVGYNVVQKMDQWGEGYKKLAKLHAQGALQNHEAKFAGIEAFGKALEDLFVGKHCGKTLVEILHSRF